MRDGSLTLPPPELLLAQAASSTTDTAQHGISREARLNALIIPIPIISK